MLTIGLEYARDTALRVLESLVIHTNGEYCTNSKAAHNEILKGCIVLQDKRREGATSLKQLYHPKCRQKPQDNSN
ncbi:hypothetical protein HI914_01157 [Erysiphe necator]|nr:hypothetical protein HI914_01157 [Erysiphe necator]